MPIAMFTVFHDKINKVRWINYSVYLCILIATIYALFLTQTNGINPYLIFFSKERMDDVEQYAAATDERLFGRIFSVFMHPMTFGCFLVNSGFFCLYKLLTKSDTKIVFPLLILIIICAIICGVRSVIGGIILGLIVLLFFNIRKTVMNFAIPLLIIVFIVSQNETLSNYIGSIFSFSEKKQIQGSSIEMRLNQLYGCFEIISSNPFFGKGFGWTTYYNMKFGDHPVLLAFESYIFVLICNWGLVGFAAWIAFLLKIYTQLKKLYLQDIDKKHILMVLFAAHYGYICITGDYAYTMFLTFFYALIYLNLLNDKLTYKTI